MFVLYTCMYIHIAERLLKLCGSGKRKGVNVHDVILNPKKQQNKAGVVTFLYIVYFIWYLCWYFSVNIVDCRV
jgi:hypothetical protein